MANVVTINRPDVVALIEEAAKRLTDGNKTEAVALALRTLLEQSARAGSLFGAHRRWCGFMKASICLRPHSMSSPMRKPAESKR